MDIVVFPSSELDIALGTLCALSPAPSSRQRTFVETIALLHGAPRPLHLVPRITPREAAVFLSDPHRRKRLVQLAVLMATVDGRVEHAFAHSVAELARALQVDDSSVRILRWLAGQHRLMVRIALMRRVMGRFLREAYRTRRARGLAQLFSAFFSWGLRDTGAASRYRALEHLPARSVGRALWEHLTFNRFGLPGEPNAIPEFVLFHDLGHVLSGYGTDPSGEIRQAAFQAGFVRRDGFAFLFFGVVQFHLGFKVTPVAAPARGHFDIPDVLTALARGAACKRDLSESFSLWPLSDLPLDQARDALGIPPLAAPPGIAP